MTLVYWEVMMKKMNSTIDKLDEVLSGDDKVGFYPNAWRRFHNVWSDTERCFGCGYEFQYIEELFNTSCVRCHKSFVE